MKRKDVIASLIKEGLSKETLSILPNKQLVSLFKKMVVTEQQEEEDKPTVTVSDEDDIPEVRAKDPKADIIVKKDMQEKGEKKKKKKGAENFEKRLFKNEDALKEVADPAKKEKEKDYKPSYDKNFFKKKAKEINGKDKKKKKNFCSKCKEICECNTKKKHKFANVIEESVMNLVEKHLVKTASKKDIVEMITTKLNVTEQTTAPAPTKQPTTRPTIKPNVKPTKTPFQPGPAPNPRPKARAEGKPAMPEFLSFESIIGSKKQNKMNAPTIAPTKPVTKPTTKPNVKPTKTPFQPGPAPNPRPKAGFMNEQDEIDYDELSRQSGMFTLNTSVDLNEFVVNNPHVVMIRLEGDDAVDLSPLCQLENLQTLNIVPAPNCIVPDCLRERETTHHFVLVDHVT